MAEGIDRHANGIDDPLGETDSQAQTQHPTAQPAKMNLDAEGLDDSAEFRSLLDEPEDTALAAADPLEPPGIRLTPPDPGVLAELNPWRWAIAFAVIAMLLALFCFILFWGLTHSFWWY